MNGPKLGSRGIRILDFCKGRPTSLTPLEEEIPRSSIYRHTRRLQRDGLLVRAGDVYTLSAKGEELLGRQAPALEVPAGPLPGTRPLPVPGLDQIPLPHHRRAAEIILACIVGRRDLPDDDHHPNLIFLGPTQTWKTTIAQMVAAIVGLDPVKAIVLCPSEAGKSLFARRNSKGSIVSKRDLLDMPLMVLDEYHEAEPPVRKTIRSFLQGTRRLAFENGTVRIGCVPVVTLNPAEGETLKKRVGLPEHILRRSIFLDTSAIAIPDELKTQGKELVAKIATAGPVELPKAKPKGIDAAKDKILRVLEPVLTDQGRALFNLDLLATVAKGMTAWLSVPDAWARAAEDYLLLAATVGWVVPRWQEVPRRILIDLGGTAAGGVETKLEPTLRERVLQLADPDRKCTVPDLDFGERTRTLTAFLRKNGIDPGDIEALKRSIAEWNAAEKREQARYTKAVRGNKALNAKARKIAAAWHAEVKGLQAASRAKEENLKKLISETSDLGDEYCHLEDRVETLRERAEAFERKENALYLAGWKFLQRLDGKDFFCSPDYREHFSIPVELAPLCPALYRGWRKSKS